MNASPYTIHEIKEVLASAGIEIYLDTEDAVHIAERIRFHFMDSGVRVHRSPALGLIFSARCQQSDYPHADAADLLSLVRQRVGPLAEHMHYTEIDAQRIEAKDPMDARRVLDVWHEITYSSPLLSLEELVDHVRWALKVEKYISR